MVPLVAPAIPAVVHPSDVMVMINVERGLKVCIVVLLRTSVALRIVGRDPYRMSVPQVFFVLAKHPACLYVAILVAFIEAAGEAAAGSDRFSIHAKIHLADQPSQFVVAPLGFGAALRFLCRFTIRVEKGFF